MKYYWILLLIIIGNGCRDKSTPSPRIIPQIYDTIKPGSYLPAWPGSSWTYNVKLRIHDEVTGEITSSEYERVSETLDDYVLYRYIKKICNYPSGIDTVYSDFVYVPVYNGTPVYSHYSTPRWVETNVKPCGKWTSFERILSDSVGDTYNVDVGSSNPQYVFLTFQVTDTIVPGIDASVLQMRGKSQYMSEEECYLYQEDVGLILYLQYDHEVKDTLVKRELIHYDINFPK